MRIVWEHLSQSAHAWAEGEAEGHALSALYTCTNMLNEILSQKAFVLGGEQHGAYVLIVQ